jgi:hypothetical protein
MADNLVNELTDFFEGRNRFAERADYVGMEASAAPGLFVGHFEDLPPAGRQQAASLLAAGLLGRVPELAPYLRQVAQLMLDLCIRGHCGYFDAARAELEAEFNDAENLKNWARAEENGGDEARFRGEWRYALILWGVLYMLRSENVGDGYEYLRGHAKSRHFRRALVDVRGMYDSEVLGDSS